MKEFDPAATAAAVQLIASRSAVAHASATNNHVGGRPQRASSPKDPKEPKGKKEKKGSEKVKKKSVTHSPTAKDHDGRKTLGPEEISTQYFGDETSQGIGCPSVNVEKSRGDDEVFIAHELNIAMGRLAQDVDLKNMASNTELAAKAREAKQDMVLMEFKLIEEEKKTEREEKEVEEEEKEEKARGESERGVRQREEEKEKGKKEEKERIALQIFRD